MLNMSLIYKAIIVGNAEADAEEMDIDETAGGGSADESAYIGDNCISTPVSIKHAVEEGNNLCFFLRIYFITSYTNLISLQALTEDNSPQDEEHLDSLVKDELLEEAGGAQEESPDQSISSAMPIDSGIGDGAAIVQDGK